LDIQWTVLAGILVINAVAAFVIAIVLARKRDTPGIHSMIYMLAGLGIWSFSYGMIMLSPTLEAKHFWLKLENVGIVAVPVLWFFFALKYTRLDKWLTRWPIKLLFLLVPAVTLVMMFSGRWLYLYYTFTQPAMKTGGPLIIGRGAWYFVQLIQNYALVLVGMGVLLRSFMQSQRIYRKQFLLLIGSVLIPFILNIVYQLFPEVMPFFNVPIDLTPLSFNVTAILLAINIFGLHLFDSVPIIRSRTVMEHIPEMVFVFDSYDRVIDANSMAQRWLGKSMEEISGQDPVAVFREWPQFLNSFFFTEHTREEIQIPGDPPYTLELVITPIYNRSRILEGRVIVAHDITQSKTLENELKEANQSLKVQLAEIESLRAKLEEQAIRDPLTDAFNRRFFAESLDREVARAIRDKVSLSVVIMDVDHFKQFNDTFGHKCGDMVLQSLATFLKDNTRRGDIVCRYGGEEFVILMPDATLDSAYERAEMWRSKFEAHVVEYEGQSLSVTFSAGVASFPEHGSTGEGVLQSADRALYRSKSTGRNRVTVYKSR
jgi:diguanylate cyclase (GGDEF)-like protein/PAS domain S-box-containing protein